MGSCIFGKKSLMRVVAITIIAQFIMTSGPVGIYASDNLRVRATKNTNVQSDLHSDLSSINKNLELKVRRIGILTGGGPASGHNEVIFSALQEAQKQGIELIAIPDGWLGLTDDKLVTQAIPLTMDVVEANRKKGATILGTARENPYKKDDSKKDKSEKVIASIQKLGLDGLITLGGDDTNGVSKLLSEDKNFRKVLPNFKIIGLPKTMDNDIDFPEAEAQTYGFDSFVRAAIPAVMGGIVDADRTHRVLVVEVFGRSAGFVASRIGSSVGASRTLIPEEELDLEALVKDLRAYYYEEIYDQVLKRKLPRRYGSVIVSEGVKISRDYKNNAQYLDAAFKSDIVAKAAYEKAEKASIDSFGHPKLENAGMIIGAVLEAAFKESKISLSKAGKIDYLFRSADVSDYDAEMCNQLGRAAVNKIVNGISDELLYVHNGELMSLSFEHKLGGREFKYLGANRDEYLKANQALGMGAKDGGAAIPSHREVVQATFNDVLDRYRELKPGQYLVMSKDDMEAVLWTINDQSAVNGDTIEVSEQIRRILNRLTLNQQDDIRALSKEMIYGNHGLSAKIDTMLMPVTIFVNAANALIHRAGAFGLFLQQNYEPGMKIVAIKSLKGAKGLTAWQFVKKNDQYQGVFMPYRVKDLRLGKPVEVNGLSIPTIIVPEDKNLNRPEQTMLYFEPDVTVEQALDVMKALNNRIDIVADYGPTDEKQAGRLQVFLDRGYRVVAASPVNTDGIKEMLKNTGRASSALKEGLFSINRKTIGPDTLILDSLTCTSNAMISVAGAVHELFGIESGTGITVHAATDSNEFYPMPSGRARSPLDELRGVPVADNIIPASTGAAKNFFKIYPNLKGKFHISAVRVGTLEGSMYSMTVRVSKDVTAQQVRDALRDFAKKSSGGVVQYYEGMEDESDAPLYAAKIVGWPSVSIIEDKLVEVLEDGRTIKIEGFYDNQSAAPNQMISRWAPWMVTGARLATMLNKVAESNDGGAVSRDIAQAKSRLNVERFNAQLENAYGSSYDKVKVFENGYLADSGFETAKDGSKINRLGWSVSNLQWILDHPETIAKIKQDAAEINSKYKYVIFCGMGGSGLSVEVVKQTFGQKNAKFYSLRTTDPAAIKAIIEDISANESGSLEQGLKNTLVIPISKSATTPETVEHRKFFEELYEKVGVDIKDHMWVITDKISPWGKEGKYPQREIQLNAGEDIGGRFTAPSTNIFLMPLALTAPDKIEAVLKRAIEMNTGFAGEQYLHIGAELYTRAKAGQDKLTMIMPEELKTLPMWSEQLFEESLGKNGKGVTVFYGEDITSQAVAAGNKDRVFLRVNLNMGDTNPSLWKYLEDNGYPVIEINANDIDDIGGIMLGLQRAVAAVGYLWDICFVDQPAVEGYKKAAKAIIDQIDPAKSPNPLTRAQILSDWQSGVAVTDGISLYYYPLVKAGILKADEIKAKVQELGGTIQQAPYVYAAVLSLLKQKPGFEAAEITSYGRLTDDVFVALQKVRTDLFTNMLKVPSKLGEGPDKNHSYQQNIEDGRNIFFSTYFMAQKNPQSEPVAFNDNMLFAQTIGTVNSMIEKGRKVVLISTEDKITQAQINKFFSTVESLLSKDGGVKVINGLKEFIGTLNVKAYNKVTLGFGNFINTLKTVDISNKGAIVVGASSLLENAGSVTALDKIKQASEGISVKVWAVDAVQAEQLQVLGIEAAFVGLDSALRSVAGSNISLDKVVLIGSANDFDAIKSEFNVADAQDFLNTKPGIKAVRLAAPRAAGNPRAINAMPLVFAKAVASILNDQEAVVKQAQKMVKAYADSGVINKQDMAVLNDLTSQLTDLPLVLVSEEVANIQMTFEETMNKI